MRSETLTAKQVQFIPAGKTRVELPAGPPAGLYLLVQPSGKKSWALRHRWRRRTRKLTLGVYPELSLAAARAEAAAARANIEQGTDPSAAMAGQKREGQPDSMRDVALEWIARDLKPRAKTWAEAERMLNVDVLPAWRHRLITKIGRADVLSLLDSIVDRGSPIAANRTFEVLRNWFNWCVARGILTASPIAGIRQPAEETTRDRVLTDPELAEAWMAAAALRFPFGPFFRLLILSAQRRGEVANMQWDQVNLKAALWTLPAAATKAKRIHDVPLPPAAVELLDSLPRFGGPCIFTTTGGQRPISGFSKGKGYWDAEILRLRKEAGDTDEAVDWRLHDLRRSAATWLAGTGVPPHVLAAMLNHTPGSTQGILAVYNRFRYLEERRAALARWAGHVLALAEPAEPIRAGSELLREKRGRGARHER